MCVCVCVCLSLYVCLFCERLIKNVGKCWLCGPPFYVLHITRLSRILIYMPYLKLAIKWATLISDWLKL